MEHVIISGIGQRTSNQDEWKPQTHTPQSPIFLVCDGVGGVNHGDIASKITSDAISTYLTHTADYSENGILQAIVYAEDALDIFKRNNESAQNMTTTLSLLAFNSSNQAIASWVGDSRVYQIRSGKVIYKSIDHTLSEYFYQNGIITKEELENFPKKNIITKGITGGDKSAVPDFHLFDDIQADDYFLICSDGFYEALDEKHFELFTPPTTSEEIKRILDAQCLSNSKDNYTCHIVKI
jgi:serine/threonine protein phosphatase PrpC